jgi:pyruvate,orthophosphate dikinase
MRKMILANDRVTRESALESLLPLQRGDFEAIFTAMAGLPVTIRLLDPPLHEFLPNSLSVDREIAEKRRSGASRAEIAALEETSRRIGELTERNPMMGFRGCRLGLVHPEIYAMQVRAILEAAIAVSRLGIVVEPEILIPLVADSREIALVRETIEREVTTITQRLGQRITFTVGTMIEVPRACLVAESLAQHTDFFSFGTNDLTQMSFGFSRDDAEGSFLRRYLEGVDRNGHTEAVLLHNPFEVLDRDGVGELMRLAIRGGRRARPHLKIGLCGEHGGEPASIALCEELRLDYVSCSPFRLAIARLAAAHAAIGTGSRDL